MKAYIAAAILFFVTGYTPQANEYGFYHSEWKNYVKTRAVYTFEDDRACFTTTKSTIIGFGNATLEQDSCFFPIDKFDLATGLSLFYSFWVDEGFCHSEETQHKLLEDLRSLEVEFSSRQLVARNVYSESGKYIAETPLHGLTLGNGDRIWVSTRGDIDVKLHKTSFVHELVHVAICTENAYIHCDPDHVGVRFGGWQRKHSQFIRKMNMYFKVINL
jgi:hypothetical protein